MTTLRQRREARRRARQGETQPERAARTMAQQIVQTLRTLRAPSRGMAPEDIAAEHEALIAEGALFGGTPGDPFMRRLGARRQRNRMGDALARVEAEFERRRDRVRRGPDGSVIIELGPVQEPQGRPARRPAPRRPRTTLTNQEAFPRGLQPRRVGADWYEVEFVQARAWYRQVNGQWSYYFRELDGTPLGAMHYFAESREECLRRIKNVARHKRWTQR